MSNIHYHGGIDSAIVEDSGIFLDSFDDRLNLLVPVDIIDWAQSAIVMESTKVGQEAGNIILEPFQIAPIRAQVEKGVKEVVIVAPEQYGKSFCWRIPKVYQMRYRNGLFVIVYEEKDKAREINDREFHPMVMAVPELAEQLRTGEGHYTKKNYEMRDNITSFLGAGADITSQRVKAAAGDEIDTWPLVYPKKIAQIDNLRKRLRRAMARGEGCLTLCSSPKGTDDNSAVWHCYQMTNQGVYTLRCMNCGGMTIPSTMVFGKRSQHSKDFVGGLKWHSENFRVIHESIRLECPVCQHQHIEDDTFDMVHYGDYVFKNPDLWDKCGFLFGSLCSYKREDGSFLALSWVDIAQKVVDTKQSNNFEEKRTLYNSFIGIPLPKKKRDEDSETTIRAHYAPLETDKIKAIVGAADTQESPWGWFWIIRGVDERFNTYLLDCGFASDRETLAEVIRGTYLDMPVSLFIVDQGGTNAEDVKALAKECHQCWQYKGASKPSELWHQSNSEGQRKLLICDATRLQIMLLRLIYEQDDQDNNYWFLPMGEQFEEWRMIANKQAKEKGYDNRVFDYIEHLISVQPTDRRDGEKYQYWDCGSHDRRDYFDCEKMLLVLVERKQFRTKLEKIMQERQNHNDKTKKAEEKQTKVIKNNWI